MVWMYHKDFPEGRLFETEEDAPRGSVDSPAKIKTRAKKSDGDNS